MTQAVVEPQEHWSREPISKGQDEYLPLSSREFFCRECRSKCTATTEGVEVGHAGGCEHRPEGFPVAHSSHYAAD